MTQDKLDETFVVITSVIVKARDRDEAQELASDALAGYEGADSKVESINWVTVAAEEV
jgi:hypothetical protein